MLNLGVEKRFDAGEVDDRVEAAIDLPLTHSEDRAVQVNVFTPGQLVVKADADFEQRSHTAAHLHFSIGRLGDPRKDLQEGAFARSIAADNADHFASRDPEGDVLKSPDRWRGSAHGAPRGGRPLHDPLAQSAVALTA